jgi:hypothetical protein
VVLYSSAPEPVHVELRAFVTPVLEVEPPTISLGRITTADSAGGTAVVRSTDGRAFRLELARTTVEHFTPELVPLEPDGQGRAGRWRVDVRLEPSATLGPRTYRVNLVSDLETGNRTGTPLIDFHAVELVVGVEVTQVFRAEPEFLTFGRVAPGQTAEVAARVEYLGGDAFPAADLRLDPVPGQAQAPGSALAYELRPREGEPAADLEVRLLGLPEGSSGSYGAILVIVPREPGLPELRLRVYLSCAPSDGR